MVSFLPNYSILFIIIMDINYVIDMILTYSIELTDTFVCVFVCVWS